MMQYGVNIRDMRITVDIDESVLDELVKLTGENKKSPAEIGRAHV